MSSNAIQFHSSGQSFVATAMTQSLQKNDKAFHELTSDEKQQVRELKKRDAEVRRHEQAHKGAAGRHAIGGAQYQYVIGPDGRRYAVSDEVKIDTSEVPDDPAATIQKGSPSGERRSRRWIPLPRIADWPQKPAAW